MTEARSNSKPAVTPRQWAIIGLLAVVLVGVIWLQLGGSEQSEGRSGPPSARPADTAPPGHTLTTGSGAEVPGKPAETPSPPWPNIPLSEAAAYDPFAPFAAPPASQRASPAGPKTKPSQDSAQRKARNEQALAALRKTGTTAVLRGPHGAMAILGRRVIRVGDEIDGFRVVAIEPDGVVVTPATAEKGHEDQL